MRIIVPVILQESGHRGGKAGFLGGGGVADLRPLGRGHAISFRRVTKKRLLDLNRPYP